MNEFYKGAFLYQLTPAGVAAQKGVREVLATRMATAGRLSAGLLPRIFDALEAIRTDADEHDDSRLLADFTNLFAIFDELADSAATYLRELDAEAGDLAADSERLSAYKAGAARLQRSPWTATSFGCSERTNDKAPLRCTAPKGRVHPDNSATTLAWLHPM